MRKSVLIIVFPIAVMLWLIGWLMVWTSSQDNRKTTTRKQGNVEREPVQISAAIYDELEEQATITEY